MIVLIGNKLDLDENNQEKREVTHEEAKVFAEENKLMFYETSALMNTNVNEAFENLVVGILTR